MPDCHLTRELLRAVASGEIPPRILAQLGLEHLMQLCPHCRREFLAWQREREGSSGEDYDRVFDTLPLALESEMPRLESERRQSLEDLQALLAIPPEERVGCIESSGTRFRGPLLVELLIEESRKQIPASPGEAYQLADLAHVLLRRSPDEATHLELSALALAHMANACRAGGDLRRAEEHFGAVRHLFSRHSVADNDVLAEVDSLEGSLRKDQRRFDEAELLLTRAAILYRMSGETAEVGRVLLTLGELHYHQGLLEPALDAVRSALESLPVESEPRLFLCGRHNLALYLAEAGRHDEAARILETDRDLYQRFPDAWSQLRLTWLHGKIAAGRGDACAAERSLVETLDGFIQEGNGYDAAMVSLDLALLYLREERTKELRILAEEMLPIFQAQDVHREAAAALVLFQDAARREALTARMIEELAAYLRSARTDPTLRFGRAPS